MGFMIKDKDGNAITMNQLDEQAAAVYGCEVDPKRYAKPVYPDEGGLSWAGLSWIDVIGWQIQKFKPGQVDLSDIKRLTWGDHKKVVDEWISLQYQAFSI